MRFLFICATLFLFILIGTKKFKHNVEVKPKFEVGDCIKFDDSDKEYWEEESNLQYMVLEIGHKSYRVSSYLLGTTDPDPEDKKVLLFYSQDFYKKVNCNKLD